MSNVLPKKGIGVGPGGNPLRFQIKFQKAKMIKKESKIIANI
jgi:hypothetical protein